LVRDTAAEITVNPGRGDIGDRSRARERRSDAPVRRAVRRKRDDGVGVGEHVLGEPCIELARWKRLYFQ